MTAAEKVKEMLEKDPGLKEKSSAEAKRLEAAKEAATPKEAITSAIKTVLDIDVTDTEMKELKPEEMESVSGGFGNKFFCLLGAHELVESDCEYSGQYGSFQIRKVWKCKHCNYKEYESWWPLPSGQIPPGYDSGFYKYE